MLRRISCILILIFISSCAQVTSLNLKKHQFGQIPTKIIWIQVAGLNEEHLALLKYSKQSAQNNTSFEDFLCIGKAWDYNLFKIRPQAYSSFHGQLTGKKNIKNSCEDYKLDPIWKYLIGQGYKAGVFEGEMTNNNSLISAKKCSEVGTKFLKGMTLWKMNKRLNKKYSLFHVNESADYKESKIYYDKSCLAGECYSTFSQNATKVFEQFTRKSGNYVYIVRDFSFLNSLNKNNLKQMRSSLIELDKTVSYFQRVASLRNDMLVLLTTAENRNIEFPRAFYFCFFK